MTDFAYDLGFSFKRVLDLEEQVLERLGQVSSFAPATLQELLSWTGVRLGKDRTFRGDVFVSRALRNPVVRG